MRQSKVLLASLMLLVGGAAITYAQVDPETDSIATDSTDWDQDVLLSESVIVGKGVIDLEENRKTPVAVSTITKQEIQDKSVGNVEFPEVMKHTPSVYVANQASGFGDGRMYLRGFDQSNTAFLLNGQPINGMEDGNMYWSNWSSMLDVANAVQVQRGLGSSKLAISSVGGTVNIVTKATEKRQGGMARFVAGNDGYMKGTIAYDSGMQGKWGFSVAFDYWTAHRKFARGTSGEGQSYFVSVGYQPNERHNINLMIFGAPQIHGQKWSNTEAEYAQFGAKYNENYGFYEGEGHNLVENYYHKPVANLNWDWTINNDLSLSTVVYASMGRGGGTGSFGTGVNFVDGARTEDGLINFDYLQNSYNSTIEGGIGSGFDGFSKRASVNNHFWYGAVSNLNYDLNEYLSFNLGADVRFYKGDHFRQLVDMYGLQGWDLSNNNRGDFRVTETFDATPWASLFNFADEDQRIGYDNSEKINYQGGFGQIEFNMSGFSAFLQGAVSNQSYQKFDRWFYEGGEAESDKVSKIGYNVKGGLAYNFVEDHTVFGNAGLYSRQPFLDNVFVFNSVDLTDPEVDNEEITGFELGYRYDTRNLKVNVNVYHTTWANRFESITTPGGDNERLLLTDVTQVHRGVEVDFFAKLSRKWSLRGFGSLGDWQYDGVTPYQIRDLDTNTVTGNDEVDLTGAKIGDAAQFTFGMGTQFEVVKGLSFDADLNYYARLYQTVDVEEVINSSLTGTIFESAPMDPYAVMDAGVTYEFKLGGTQAIRFRGNVKNVFNTSYRIQQTGNDFYFGLGRTWNAGIQYNF